MQKILSEEQEDPGNQHTTRSPTSKPSPFDLSLAAHTPTMRSLVFVSLAVSVLGESVLAHSGDSQTSTMTTRDDTSNGVADAIIIGSGLAGLTTALTILDAGGRVTILEKEAKLGGNSMKASSGINACNEETADSFREDTLRSAGQAGDPALVEQLVQHSNQAVMGWLRERLEVDLSQVTQLGGHSQARTHRPGGKLPIGAEIMIKLQKAVQAFKGKGTVNIISGAKATQLVQSEDGGVVGVVYESRDEAGAASTNTIHAQNVVLATGGFAADRSKTSWLAKIRPELLRLGATAGEFSTGDGLSLAQSVQAFTAGPRGMTMPKRTRPGSTSRNQVA